MSTAQFTRSLRILGPDNPSTAIHVDAPPATVPAAPRNVLMIVMPLVMLGGTVGFLIVGGGGTTSLLMGGMMILSLLGMLASGGGGRYGAAAGVVDADRSGYLRHLDRTRIALRNAGAAQRCAGLWTHPDPADLMAIVCGPRLWERRPTDPDFGRIRLGVGRSPLVTTVNTPELLPDVRYEPQATGALHRLLEVHGHVDLTPITTALLEVPTLTTVGPEARGLARALVVGLCALHGPDDVAVAVLVDAERRSQWEWAKWLPHVQHPRECDGVGAARMITGSVEQLRGWLAPALAQTPDTDRRRYLVLVVDTGGSMQALTGGDEFTGITVVEILDSETASARLPGLRWECRNGMVGEASIGGTRWRGLADQVSVGLAETLARLMAGWRTGPVGAHGDTSGDVGLTALLGVGDAHGFDPETAWRDRSSHRRLRIPIGVTSGGAPMVIDLKEAAHGGMGPHGLIVGATGSGKSEVLRTLVVGLAATHSSAVLNLILIDFKGGATFLGLQQLPQVAAVVTNLADDVLLVDRMRDALAGELHRRQELLRAAGNFASVADYERARSRGMNLDPLPSLVIVCDEFTELLTQRADFAELFVAIGRLGRSLAVHLLLASQRLEDGRMRGLDSHLSYRIGLKTFSAAESRAVLNSPVAYELPSRPGSAYLKWGTAAPVRFDAAYVSGPSWVPPRSNPPDVPGQVQIFSSQPSPADPHGAADPPLRYSEPESPVARTVADELVRRMVGHGPPAHPVWLPPLTTPPTLDQLLTEWEGEGRSAPGRKPSLEVPVGWLDRPFDQRRDVHHLDFTGAAGHAVVVGGPRSGKSNLLRTIVSVLALRCAPDEFNCYGIDLGGGSLPVLSDLPHVGDIATRREPDLIRRMIAELIELLTVRERQFGERRLDSMASCRAARGAGSADECADVFLIIDGWGAFRAEFDALEADVLTLVQRGLTYGIHVVLSAARWADLRPAMKDLMLTRVELRLGDPAESDIDRRAAASVPEGIAGRGLSPGMLHFRTALPRIDGIASSDDLGAGLAGLVAGVIAAWPKGAAPRVRLLPTRLPVDLLPPSELLPPAAGGRGTRTIPIGVDEAALRTVDLDFDIDPHLLVFGDQGCGKTSFLTALTHQIISRHPSSSARVLLIDYRRTMLGEVPEEHLAGYAPTAAAATALLAEVVTVMRGRVPGPAVTAAALRDRSWWTGPDLFVIVDDYDLVQVGSGNPVEVLLDLLPQARDIGLHLVLCRRAGGAARSMYEPVTQRIRELGSPGVLMSAPRDEGVLLGSVRSAPQPPGRGYLVSRQAGQRVVQFICRG